MSLFDICSCYVSIFIPPLGLTQLLSELNNDIFSIILPPVGLITESNNHVRKALDVVNDLALVAALTSPVYVVTVRLFRFAVFH